MIETNIKIIPTSETYQATSSISKYFLWGYSGEVKCLVITANKKPPADGKGFYLLFELGAVRTNKPISIHDNQLPSVGDVCRCNEVGNIEILTIE